MRTPDGTAIIVFDVTVLSEYQQKVANVARGGGNCRKGQSFGFAVDQPYGLREKTDQQDARQTGMSPMEFFRNFLFPPKKR